MLDEYLSTCQAKIVTKAKDLQHLITLKKQAEEIGINNFVQHEKD